MGEPRLSRDDIAVLSCNEIIFHSRGCLSLSREVQRRKSILVDCVHQWLTANPTHLQHARLAEAIRLKGLIEPAKQTRKRKADDITSIERKKLRTEDWSRSAFMRVPTDEERRECHTRFIDATSRTALAQGVCAVCARECGAMDESLSSWRLLDIPNGHRLVPAHTHPAHDLYEGMLLEPAGVSHPAAGCTVQICSSCITQLRNERSLCPPSLSLANGMWIGRVPWQLQILTFPEQLLIALLYPRVYVFKLFPKKIAGARRAENLQRSMRGNVSTFELSIDGVADMIEGRLMPRPPRILASLISITFVSAGQLQKKCLHSMFRIRCQVVFNALKWLKENNEAYYGDMEISEERIQQLPEDNIPVELLHGVRQSPDTGIVDQESEGYVPLDEEEEGDANIDSHDLPGVIPLQATGTIDTDLTNISCNELMMWGLNNLWANGSEGEYAVKHGSHPIPDFRDRTVFTESNTNISRNLFERAFPCLFPYGRGGMEGRQGKNVDLGEHVRWALCYNDQRFRTHETFPFFVFGILQRRQALHSARIQMQRSSFDRDAKLLSTISKDMLMQAIHEEEKNMPVSHLAVKLLKKLVYAAAGHIMGSDQSRYQLRSQIWSTAIYMNPPSLWITINPCDLHDPIVQVFAGSNINMDTLSSVIGPSKEERARNVARDPYAAAKFFHFTIQMVLETLFDVKVTSQQV
ncbi:hypothetical protein M405DRAFT_865313 [Rhizopogon salebrosus TDB-379]|nr:hypothetical protein M405DRAFT_865313 [Rhizopogon salebrosus TDB-379]